MSALPDRAEMAARVRRYRVEGYEVDDLIQEAYLCLLDPDSDHDIDKHLRRLSRRATRRKPRVVQLKQHEDADDLATDDIKARTGDDYDALVLMIAAQSECPEDKLLDLLATGATYRDICQEFRCNKAAARKRVSRFRRALYPKLYEEVLL